MADTLEGLRTSLNDIRNSITSWAEKRQGYLDKAAEIQTVYNRLKKDKDTIKGYKETVESYSRVSYDDFIGDNYQNVYKPEVTDLVSSYDTVIKKIDINLDALNEEILRQKNLASDCLGPLGELGRAWDTVKTKIENWLN